MARGVQFPPGCRSRRRKKCRLTALRGEKTQATQADRLWAAEAAIPEQHRTCRASRGCSPVRAPRPSWHHPVTVTGRESWLKLQAEFVSHSLATVEELVDLLALQPHKLTNQLHDEVRRLSTPLIE